MSDWYRFEQTAPPITSAPYYHTYRNHHHPAAVPYEYYTGDRPQAGHSTVPMDAYDDEAPDVIIIKNRGKSFTLEFPAFAIGDGILTVGNVRDAAADQLDVSPPRRVKLLYKGRLLKDDTIRAKSVGLKQNSQVLCVISEDFGPEGSSSELSGDEQQQRPSTRGSGAPRRRRSRPPSSAYDDAPRNPELLQEPPRQRRQRSTSSSYRDSRPSNLTPQMDNGGRSPRLPVRSPSRGPPPADSRPPPKPRGSPKLPTQSPDINTARSSREKVEMLEHYFATVMEPICLDYIEDPPADRKARDFEHKRLSETAMTQLMLKLDEIELEGDETARQRRKALIDRVHQLLKEVDHVANH